MCFHVRVRLAETFLLSQRNRQGWWMDFQLAPGFSDEWVTAYVGTVLASISNAGAEEAARDAWELLQTRIRPEGSWGYNAITPDDADSTAWGILLANIIGAGDVDRAKQARRRLEQHIRPNGGVAAYAEDRAIRRFIGAPVHRSFRGWCGSQACVTAAVAAIPDVDPRTLEYLRGAQEDDGSWKSYWWCEDDYATALAAEALAQSGEKGDSIRVERAALWAMRRVATGCVPTDHHPNGSPFATAWCLRTLLLAPDVSGAREAVRRATSWLCLQQRDDGSWQPSARLRVPFPDDEHPDSSTQWTYHGRVEGSIVFDSRGVFTTATVLGAIHPALNPASDHQS